MATSMFRTSSLKCNRFVALINKRQTQSLATQESEDNDAHYPPIKPKYPPGRWGSMPAKIAWSWEGQREKVAALKSTNEKIQLLTEKEYKVWRYNSVDPTPHLLRYQCGVTKTKIISGLPDVYSSSKLSVDLEKDLFKRLKNIFVETIIQEHEINRQRFLKSVKNHDFYAGTWTRDTREYNLSNLLVKSILLNVLGAIGGQRTDISKSHVDYNAKVAAYWSRHGFQRKKLVVPSKDKQYIRQNNAVFYGEHTVDFQVRKKKPLPKFVQSTHKICFVKSNSRANLIEHSPRVLGQFMEKVPRKVTAGYNFGDPNVFNHLSVIFTNKHQLSRIEKYGEEYKRQADVGYALSTGFLSTLAQAHMLGFNELEELTEPLTTQTILTDGRKFILSAYQLNTVQLWKDNNANKIQNICWVTGSMDLYEKYENGQLVGFNDDLFKMLIKFFKIKPSRRDGLNLSLLSEQLSEMPTKVLIPDRKVYEVIEEEIVYDRT